MANSQVLPEPRKWVVWSTRDSINNNIPSVAAVIETLVAVAIYWWFSVHFETYSLLLISVAVAPLVLLRSDKSVELGVRWFGKWERRVWDDEETEEIRDHFAIGLIAGPLAGFTAYCLVVYFPESADGWTAAHGFAIGWISVAVVGVVSLGFPTTGAVAATLGREATSAGAYGLAGGIAGAIAGGLGGALTVAIAIAAAVAAAGVVIGILSSPRAPPGTALIMMVFGAPVLVGFALGLFALSLVVRFGATISHICRGLQALPRNFQRLVVCTSPFQEPELVPGLTTGETHFTWPDMWRLFRSRSNSGGIEQKVSVFFTYPTALLLWFFPGWFYRLTLKSTAWFWFPLAYLTSDLRDANYPELFRRRVLETLWGKTSRVIALTTLIFFVLSNVLFLR